MARSFSNAKLLSSFVVDQIYIVERRGYIASSSEGVSRSVMMKKVNEESKKSTSWVPDPVTGYYAPEVQTNKLDVADLRELPLKQNTRQN